MSSVLVTLVDTKRVELGLIFLDQNRFQNVSLLLATNHFQKTIGVSLATIVTEAMAEAPVLILGQSTLKMLLHPTV